MLEPLPAVEIPVRPPSSYVRHLPPSAAFDWLAAGWKDLRNTPMPSIFYGVVIFAASVFIIWAMIAANLPWLIFPALSSFLVVGPILAIGLYQKSRRLAAGEAVQLSDMIVVRPASGGQLVFAGLLLCLLVVLWLRSADLLYALFFGLLPFPGFDHIMAQLLTTSRGWMLIATGSAVGGLFAAFAMAISLFSIPMLLSERTDGARHQYCAYHTKPTCSDTVGCHRCCRLCTLFTHRTSRPHHNIPAYGSWYLARLAGNTPEFRRTGWR